MAHNSWTEEEKRIVRDNYLSLSDEDIAKLIPNHSATSIATMRRRERLIREGFRYSFSDAQRIMSEKGYQLLSEETDFKGTQSIVRFLCPKHGEQELQFGRLVAGRGCKACRANTSSPKRVPNQRDVEDCLQKDLTYCETSNSVINGISYVMVSFICNKHVDKGVQTIRRASLHNSKQPCKYCSHRGLNKQTLLEIINDNKLNCIDVLSLEIKGIKDHVRCRCNLHNIEYETLVESVIDGRGCNKCKVERQKNYLTFEEAQEKLRQNKHDVVLLTYTQCSAPIRVQCVNCGEEWETRITEPSRCPNCDNKFKGESLVYQILKSRNIDFIPQHKFADCVDEKELVFDFYIPSANVCIEYNGKQHYMPISYFGGEERYLKQVRHDEIKRRYCEENNISLIEIKYTANTYEKVEQILKDVI